MSINTVYTTDSDILEGNGKISEKKVVVWVGRYGGAYPSYGNK